MQKLPTSTVQRLIKQIDKATGKVLSGLRRDLNVSQQAACDWMGWADRSTLSRIERGRRPVAVRELVLFARLYEVTTDRLWTDINHELHGQESRANPARR